MARMIDVDQLNWGRCPANASQAKAWLDEAPTVDAVEVVHARWKFHKGHFNDFAECSNCGDFHGKEIAMAMNYCPNCGAKMDGGN